MAPTITGISHVDLSVTDLEASVRWYTELLGLVPLFGGRNADHDYDVQYLIEPTSGVVMGFEQHDANPGTPFDERRVGLDHLSFNVADRAALDAWRDRLDELGIAHSGITEEDNWDVLVLRDPDNIQLELFLLKIDPSAILGG
ncbi:MAG: VOC family protein [Acidimicrobiales bacterium]|nr:VOC family protein [Acidimicrobiales bacterium]MCB1017743.1 VOC family protein [Acidimicrobiales bacterium]MCB9373534.1 VOC family protein [Microthrixaceae bacterium]